MTALAAIAFMLSRGLAFALPATQLFVAAEDRNRLWRDFRVRTRLVGLGRLGQWAAVSWYPTG